MDNEQSIEIRSLIEELRNQIVHLEHSQNQLSEALSSFPEDQDYADALRENSLIVLRKKSKLAELETLLESIDPAFKAERDCIKRMISGVVDESTLSVNLRQDAKDSRAGQTFHQQQQLDKGIYL